MRAWLFRAPWWSFVLLNAVGFGAAMAVMNRLWGDPWQSALVTWLVCGGVYGALLGLLPGRRDRYVRAIAGEPCADRLAWLGWLRRQPGMDSDPELREAARRVAVAHRTLVLRQGLWAVPVFAVMLFVSGRLALDRSPWYWLAVFFFAAFLAAHVLVPRLLGRRAEELAAPGRGAPGAAGMLAP